MRFYQRQDLRTRREQIADGRQHELERDETHVDGGEVGRVRQTRRIELADIGLLEADDVVAAAQPRVQLAGADVDRVDPLGAAREQHLGEAAGRCADVEADAAGDVETEMIERGGKLDAAARHIGVLGRGGDDGGGGDFLGGFANRDAVGGHPAGGDRGLRPRAAIEQAARDQQAIGSFAMGHGCNYTTVMRRACRRPSTPLAPQMSCSRRGLRRQQRSGHDDYQASLITSPRMFWPSASKALATMPLASRPALAYMAFGES